MTAAACRSAERDCMHALRAPSSDIMKCMQRGPHARHIWIIHASRPKYLSTGPPKSLMTECWHGWNTSELTFIERPDYVCTPPFVSCICKACVTNTISAATRPRGSRLKTLQTHSCRSPNRPIRNYAQTKNTVTTAKSLGEGDVSWEATCTTFQRR